MLFEQGQMQLRPRTQKNEDHTHVKYETKTNDATRFLFWGGHPWGRHLKHVTTGCCYQNDGWCVSCIVSVVSTCCFWLAVKYYCVVLVTALAHMF